MPWSRTTEHAGSLIVEAIETTTPDAYRAIWELLLDFDLTRRVMEPARPSDAPLRWMLKNPRAMRITRTSDNLWMRLLDLPTALESRRYSHDHVLVLEVEPDEMCPDSSGRWTLEVGPGGPGGNQRARCGVFGRLRRVASACEEDRRVAGGWCGGVAERSIVVAALGPPIERPTLVMLHTNTLARPAATAFDLSKSAVSNENS